MGLKVLIFLVLLEDMGKALSVDGESASPASSPGLRGAAATVTAALAACQASPPVPGREVGRVSRLEGKGNILKKVRALCLLILGRREVT